jgi:chorismate synthase
MSSFGTLFRVTTFGESHCKGVGAIVDGVPPLLRITEEDIQPQLNRRRPGQSRITTPRNETDKVTILSGTERGVALGTPIALFVPNENVRPGDYSEMDTIPRPGHADYTYQVKYGIRAASGGGRSSARETIGRVAAGAIAEKWLREEWGTEIVTFVSSVGSVAMNEAWRLRNPHTKRKWTRDDVDRRGTLTLLRDPSSGWTHDGQSKESQSALDDADDARFVEAAASYVELLKNGASHGPPCYEDVDGKVYDREGVLLEGVSATKANRSNDVIAVRCPDTSSAARMATLIREVKAAKDSIGGTLTTIVSGVPIGLGEPCFDKLEAKLAQAMLSLPATKAFEIGAGFEGTKMRGSEHNDVFALAQASSPVSHGEKEKSNVSNDMVLLRTVTNNAGGTLGGISNGADIVFRVAIKSVSTISQAQETVGYDGKPCVLEAKGRHDPCVLPRAPPLIEAMTALVLADAALIQRSRGKAIVTLPSEEDEENVF